jgi:hypothetical protein
MSFAEKEWPIGTIPKLIEKQSELSGFSAAKITLGAFIDSAKATFKYLPNILKEKKIDFLIIDQCNEDASIVAEYLKIPYVTVCNALIINQDPWVPPGGIPWKYSNSFLSKFRNKPHLG